MSSPTSVFPSFRRKSASSKAADLEAKQKREAAVREAKQRIHDVVRVDWTFDPLETIWSSPLPPKPSSSVANTNSQIGTDVRANIVQWRMREPGSSSESDSDTLDAYTRNKAATAAANAMKNGGGRDHDPYRFDNPDSIKFSILERGRRRRADLEEEMKWNPGLRFFIERRNAWTGARKRRSVLTQRRREEEADLDPASLSSGDSEAIGSDPRPKQKSDGFCEGSSSPIRMPKDLLEDLALSEEKSRDTTTTTLEEKDSILHHDNHIHNKDEDHIEFDTDTCLYDSDDSMIPVAEPFIAQSNHIRSSITPAIYASLYSKVIVQSLTPTIPINLSDVTKALVAGWKADGQWPPKPTIPPPGSDVPVKRKGSAKNHVFATLSLASKQNHNAATATTTNTNNITASAQPGDAADGSATAGPGSGTGRKPSFGNQASNAVRKVLALSSHSFHLRRSSRSETSEQPTSPVSRRRSSAADGAVVVDAPAE